MFNFLFEGKIGDILAPVVPTNQLFLAIQHQKNHELPALVDKQSYSSSNLNECGYAAIHVACRYNNRYAIDLLLSRGAHVMLMDQNGNSPLHYAAKYGHLELCKYLIEHGSQANIKNKQQQTPYDVAQSHSVRQFLLPLQFQAEREVTSDSYGQVASQTMYSDTSTPTYAPTAMSTTVPQTTYGQNLNTVSYGSVPPPAAFGVPSTYGISSTSNKSASTRFQPDGFHSSASDPVLQQKYGHVIEKPMIAPPPITQSPIVQSLPSYNSQGGSGLAPTVFNRYVPYDVNNSQPPVPYVPYAPPQAVTAPIYHHPPPSYPVPQPNMVNDTKYTNTVSPTTAPGTTNANKLLANKAVTTNAHDDLPSIISPQIRRIDDRKFGSDSPKNFSTKEEDVINASAASSSIL